MRGHYLGCVHALRAQRHILSRCQRRLVTFRRRFYGGSGGPLRLLRVRRLGDRIGAIVSSLSMGYHLIFRGCLCRNVSPRRVTSRRTVSMGAIHIRVGGTVSRVGLRLNPATNVLFLFLCKEL